MKWLLSLEKNILNMMINRHHYSDNSSVAAYIKCTCYIEVQGVRLIWVILNTSLIYKIEAAAFNIPLKDHAMLIA